MSRASAPMCGTFLLSPREAALIELGARGRGASVVARALLDSVVTPAREETGVDHLKGSGETAGRKVCGSLN